MPMMSPTHAATVDRFATDAGAALDALDILDTASHRILYDFTMPASERLDTLRKIIRARRHIECTARAFINWTHGSARIELAIAARENGRS